MSRINHRQFMLGAASALAVAVSLGAADIASAQVATSTLRGVVSDAGGVESGGTVTATEIATGYVSRGRINADGTYVLPGLRPGTYRIQAVSADGETATETVTLALGQVGTLNLAVASGSAATATPGVAQVEDVIVTGRRLFEVRTSEVATNVTQQQINDLPQISRNFLNFAALAPGVVVQEGDTERTISAGGQPSVAVNVFIDGQNQKSTIIDGGIAGQDDSRGNPFPQAAVQEFRVLSQNFKAEYEQASSAIITSVTRSGTNTLSGDLFVNWQDGDWTEQNVFSRRRGDARPRLDRLQYGGSIGGPIIEDRLHYFLTYERKEETRERPVFLNRTEYTAQFDQYLGTFEAPFEQDLLFGKLSWQVNDRQRIDLAGTYRSEQDIRDFGNGPTAFERAVAVNVDVYSVNLRHQYQGDRFLNEFSVDYLLNEYNPTALNFDMSGARHVIYRDNVAGTPGFDFAYGNIEATVFQMGGGANNQDIRHEGVTFRNDLTLPDVNWMGLHTIKMGVKYSMQDYYVAKMFNRNPNFTYDVTANPAIFGSATIPTQVVLNLPVAPTDVRNNVLGLYIQDDWQITDKLEINLGLRWDYEDNAVNNDWTTPQVVRDLLAAFQGSAAFTSPVDLSEYVADGGRDAFMGAFQPRIGFSYDVFGDEQTVLFGGAGRYYDRIPFNFAFSERFALYNLSKTIYFSPNGGAFGGQADTVAWDPIYGTTAGLDTLLAGTRGRGEVFLIQEDAPSPHTDQFNLGIRQKFGSIQAALTFTYSKTENEFQWSRLNVNAQNQITVRPSQFIDPATGLPFAFNDSVFYSDHNREREYRAIYLTLDRPYNHHDGYGFSFTYTLADGETNGSRDQGTGNFDFDYATIANSPYYNLPGVERHRIVATGTVRLPWDMRLSSIVTLGSGRPFTGFPGGGRPIEWFAHYPERRSFLIPDAFAYRQVDFRLTKAFEMPNNQVIELTLDAINLFNFENYSGFNQSMNLNAGQPTETPNPAFGLPTAQFTPTRTFQIGLRYAW